MKFNIMYEVIFSKENQNHLKGCNFIHYKKVKNFKKIDAIYSFLKKDYNKEYLSKFKNLKFFLTASTGLSHVDIEFLKKKKIKLIKLNTKSKEVKKITSTGELVLTILLSAIRKLYQYIILSKKGILQRDKYKIFQFKNYD